MGDNVGEEVGVIEGVNEVEVDGESVEVADGVIEGVAEGE